MGGEVGWWEGGGVEGMRGWGVGVKLDGGRVEGWRGVRGKGRKKCRPAPNVLEILPIFLCRIFSKFT